MSLVMVEVMVASLEGAQKAQAQLDGFDVYNDLELGGREKAKLVIVKTNLSNRSPLAPKKKLLARKPIG